MTSHPSFGKIHPNIFRSFLNACSSTSLRSVATSRESSSRTWKHQSHANACCVPLPTITGLPNGCHSSTPLSFCMTQQVLLQLRTSLAMGNDVRSARRSETSQPEDWRVLNEKIKLILADINFTYGPAAYYRNILILKPCFLFFITVLECSESSHFSFFWSQQVWSVWVGDGQQAKQVMHRPQLALRFWMFWPRFRWKMKQPPEVQSETNW